MRLDIILQRKRFSLGSLDGKNIIFSQTIIIDKLFKNSF